MSLRQAIGAATAWAGLLFPAYLLAGPALPDSTPQRAYGTTLSEAVTVSGYGSFRFEANASDAVRESFTFRRFIVNTDVTLAERIRIYSEVEYERLSEIEVERGVEAEAGGIKFEQEVEGTNESELAVEQMWAQYQIHPYLAFRIGVVLPPLGRFNERHDDDLWDLPRRPLLDRGAPVLPVAAAWSEVGAGFVGSLPLGESGKLDYTAYVLNGTSLDFAIEEVVQTRDPRRDKLELEAELKPTQGAFDGGNDANALSARLAWSPSLGNELALSTYAGEYTPDFLGVSRWITALGVDGAWSLGGVEAEGEFVYTKFTGLRDVAREFARVAGDRSSETSRAEAANLETEVELEMKGLASNKYGFWLDLKYRFWPTLLNRTFLGKGFENPQLIPILRLERVRFDNLLTELDFAGGVVTALETEPREQDRISLGLAYRPVPTVVIHLAYEHNEQRKGSQLLSPALRETSTDGFLFGLAFGF